MNEETKQRKRKEGNETGSLQSPGQSPGRGFDQTQLFELARSTKQRRARHRPATTKQWCAPSANSQRRQPTRQASDMLVQHNNNNTQQQGHKNKNTPPHRTGEDTMALRSVGGCEAQRGKRGDDGKKHVHPTSNTSKQASNRKAYQALPQSQDWACACAHKKGK